jgi:hypothetical protein
MGLTLTLIPTLDSDHFNRKIKSISTKQFNLWQKKYLFDAIKGISYGQSFCETFKVLDYRIYFLDDKDLCDQIIKKWWINDRNNISNI